MNINSKKFQIFAQSVAKVGKEKCGDSCMTFEIEDENILLLAVADGVSSCPCDWLASSLTCETIKSFFLSSNEPYNRRMISAAKQAHAVLQQTGGECRGLATSLSLVAWDINNDEICVLNVGDSRVYLGSKDGLSRITRDDSASVPVSSGRSFFIEDGIPVLRRGVTKTLGQSEPLSFSVKFYDFFESDFLFLVTDGVSNDESFTLELNDLLQKNFTSGDLQQFLSRKSEINRDDATLVILRRIAEN